MCDRSSYEKRWKNTKFTIFPFFYLNNFCFLIISYMYVRSCIRVYYYYYLIFFVSNIIILYSVYFTYTNVSNLNVNIYSSKWAQLLKKISINWYKYVTHKNGWVIINADNV